MHNAHKIQFEINAVHLNFLFYTFYQVLNKKVSQFPQKILSSTTDHNNNKKGYFEQQIAILEWFLKDHVTLKTEGMATENSVE